MSYRTRRVLFITPFYMLFEFFLLKYIFLLFGGVEDNYILILTVLIGLNHFMPMLFEERKSHKVTRFLSTLDGVWMWASNNRTSLERCLELAMLQGRGQPVWTMG